MVLTMVPPVESLPLIAEGSRVKANGMPAPELRAELRRIRQWRNAAAIASTWLQTFGMIVGVSWVVERTGQWWLWAPTFVLMGRGHAMLNILGHEAAHRLLFSRRRVNDIVGKLFCSFPSLSNQDAYRRVHMAHHRDEFGPEEPDLDLYRGYPITRASLWRKLRRDATGESGYKNLRQFLRQFRRPKSRRNAGLIVVEQLVLFVLLGVTVAWWAWPVLWLGSWLTVWRVLNRLRAIAEHAGMTRSADKRQTTHHVRQGWLPRFLMAPYKVGYHLAHHVDAGIPMWSLPRLTRELERAGYISESITYPSYRALWRELSSRPE